MQQAFSEYIKIIGKGQKGGRSLTRDEAYNAMKMVLAGEVTGDQRGAFLMLLRTREETPEEVIGFVDAVSKSIKLYLDVFKFFCAELFVVGMHMLYS